MSADAKHTPTPWRVELYGNSVPGYDVCDRISGAKFTGHCAHHGLSEPDARFIVRACNAHEKLVAALESALEYFEDRQDVVDGPYGEPAPNKEMRLVQELRAALSKGSV